MAKPKKESKPCSLRMEATLYERLDEFCQETGISKTAVLEKGAIAFMDNYISKMKEKTQTA